MSAEDIARALGGAKRNGAGWLARCPVPSHGQGRGDVTPSLSLHDGEDGRLLVCCFGGCVALDVLAAIRARGLGDHRAQHHAPPRKVQRIVPDRAALEIWRDSKPIAGTLAENYLNARGIRMRAWPPTLRFHHGLRYFEDGHPGAALILPAMVCAVQAPDRRIVAIHRTFLRPDGSGKAHVTTPKKGLGCYHGGAVRLGPAGAELGFAEGIEDALAAQFMTEIPCWAAAGAGRLHSIALPPEVREVHLFADNDGPGRAAAEKAGAVYARQGRRAWLRYPPEAFKDWCAWLAAGAPEQ